MENSHDFGECEFAAVIPLRTVSAANAREHWTKKAARNRKERLAVALYFRACPSILRDSAAPLVVSLRRFGKRLLDDDNLAGSFKAIRDEVAASLRRDDGPKSGIRWDYSQAIAKEYAIEIRVRHANEARTS